MARCIAALVCAVVASGCTAPVGQLALASTRPIFSASPVLRRGVLGADCAQNVLGIPLGNSAPNLNDAVAEAVAEVPGGTMLINASIADRYMISGLYNVSCLRVTGDVVGK